jgi:hypothetical protein
MTVTLTLAKKMTLLTYTTQRTEKTHYQSFVPVAHSFTGRSKWFMTTRGTLLITKDSAQFSVFTLFFCEITELLVEGTN